MRRTTEDKTLERNYLSKWRFLIQEYELVKAGRHHRFKFVQDFYAHHGTNRQTFAKYYNRYRRSGSEEDLLPRKRGPKWKSRRTLPLIEQKVLEQREKGINRYEIYAILKPVLKDHTPKPSTIYKIVARHGKGRLTPKMQQNKRKIIKEKAGELGHLDCHYLGKDMIENDPRRYYLVCVIDDCTRLAWSEVVGQLTSLDVMFASLKCINLLHAEYGIRFDSMLTDNGSELSCRTGQPEKHPFERMLIELDITHRYTRPYRPQTNGKVERFWRTLNDDLIEGTSFDSIQHFKDELQQYLIYYNKLRPHQALNGTTPYDYNLNLSPNY